MPSGSWIALDSNHCFGSKPGHSGLSFPRLELQIKKILIASLLASVLTGCAGVMTVTGSKYTVSAETKPGARNNICPGAKVGEYEYCDKAPTMQAFKDTWGDPSSASKSGEKDVWKYNRDIALRGFVLGLGIPLPVLLPAGMNQEILTFDAGTLVERTTEHGEPGPSAGCFYNVETGNPPFICGAGR